VDGSYGEGDGTIGPPQTGVFPAPALSRDGGRIALSAADNDNTDVWIHDVARVTRTRLTLDPSTDIYPEWSPDGRSVAYQFIPKMSGDFHSYAVLMRSADGGGNVDTLAKDGAVLPSFSPDGHYVVYSTIRDLGWDVLAVPLQGERKPIAVVHSDNVNSCARVSPDGRYIAYASDESGRREIYLKRFPSGDGKWEVSVAGGEWPRWNGTGDHLYYLSGDDVEEVAMVLKDVPSLSTPVRLFSRPGLTGRQTFGLTPGYAVSGDGHRFLLLRYADEHARVKAVTLVQNWIAAFRKRNWRASELR
jgi:eukaryotic-like serine/threonine-protein kinase